MTTRAHSRPKLRSSCDTCQALKIKCGQEKPTCRRCQSHRLDCVYGISRRMGKPRGRKPPEQLPTPASQVSASAAASLSAPPTELSRAQSIPLPPTPLPLVLPPRPPPPAPPAHKSPPPSRGALVESSHHASALLGGDGHELWSPLSLWNLDAGDLLSNGSDVFEDFSAPHSIASPPENAFMADHCSLSATCPVDDSVQTEHPILQKDTMADGEGGLCTTGSTSSNYPDQVMIFNQQPVTGAPLNTPCSGGAAAIGVLAPSATVAFNNPTLTNPLSPAVEEGYEDRKGCNCYLFALQSLARLERVSRSHHSDLAFDTILAFARETLCHCFDVLECSACPANSSCLLMYSLLVGKITQLCRTGCSAYGICKQDHERHQRRRVSLKVGNYEIRGEEEKILVGVLMQRRLGEIGDILGRLNTAVQKLPHNREANACRDVVADAYQKLGSITSCSEM